MAAWQVQGGEPWDRLRFQSPYPTMQAKIGMKHLVR